MRRLIHIIGYIMARCFEFRSLDALASQFSSATTLQHALTKNQNHQDRVHSLKWEPPKPPMLALVRINSKWAQNAGERLELAAHSNIPFPTIKIISDKNPWSYLCIWNCRTLLSLSFVRMCTIFSVQFVYSKWWWWYTTYLQYIYKRSHSFIQSCTHAIPFTHDIAMVEMVSCIEKYGNYSFPYFSHPRRNRYFAAFGANQQTRLNPLYIQIHVCLSVHISYILVYKLQ